MAISSFVKRAGIAGSNVWQRLPERTRATPPLRTLGALIHGLSRRISDRSQTHSTWFLRNQPLLVTICDLTGNLKCESLRVCSIGCSTGAEIYSLLWTVRKAWPDLKISAVGVDRSEETLAKAKSGRYLRQDPELRGMSEDLLFELFDVNGEVLKIKDWIAKGVQWLKADACHPSITSLAGIADIVLANNFLIHMREREAIGCVFNVVRLVKPGGLFVCRGMDLDLRERIAKQLQLEPISARIEEIHDADARSGWPWKYWGLEPLDKTRRHWTQRYATVFRVPAE